MKKTIIISVFVILLFAGIVELLAAQHAGKTIQSGKLQVVASFYPMYFFASQIGGNKAEVFTITPASAEPHEYEPTTQDIAKVTDGNMLVLNGGKLESWGVKLRDQLSGSDVLVVTAGDGLANKNLSEDGQTIQDPHIWQDPLLAKQEVSRIEKGYEKIDPKDAGYFRANAKKLEGRLDQLDQEFRQGLSTCRQKDFVTSHAAFGYLAARYGINQVAISGISPDQEPSSQKLAEIADLVKKEHIDIVFFESLVSPKLSQTMASETGAKTMVLDPIEGITQDGLRAGQNYLTIMRSNLAALQVALQCTK